MTQTSQQGVQAISKEQVQDQIDQRVFPDFVIQAFNECIAESKTRHSNEVTQDAVVERIMKLGSIERAAVFSNNFLDVEAFYKRAGWKVEFHRKAYNETGSSYFVFK